ncbi:extracellular repeat protein, HAF family, partial [mine drainage metagenome]
NNETISGTCDLGTLRNNQLSEALGINDRNQVVGTSFGGTAPQSAFIWQKGHMVNLNKLVVPGTTLILTDAQEINDNGVITGQALDPATGALVAFMAIPTATGDGTASPMH